MLKRFVVKKSEQGALFRDADFERLLPAGRHHFFDPLGRLSLTTWPLGAPMTDTALADYLLQQQPASATAHLEVMELNEDEAGLRYENDVLVEVLPPGSRRFFWKGRVRHRLQRCFIFMGQGGFQQPPACTLQFGQHFVRREVLNQDKQHRTARLELGSQLFHEIIVNADVSQSTADGTPGSAGRQSEQRIHENQPDQQTPEAAGNRPGSGHIVNLVQLDLAFLVAHRSYRILQVNQILFLQTQQAQAHLLGGVHVVVGDGHEGILTHYIHSPF